MSRILALDTETTEISSDKGGRILEIACVEMENGEPTGALFHRMVNPECALPSILTIMCHHLPDRLDKLPLFADIAPEFIEFIRGKKLVIFRASFDLQFFNHEFSLISPFPGRLENLAEITDPYLMAQTLYPDQYNSLGALSKRLGLEPVDMDSCCISDALMTGRVYHALTRGTHAR